MGRLWAMELKTLWMGTGCIAVLIALGAAGQGCSAAAERTVQAIETVPEEISVSQAKEKRELGAFILDVREPNEWEQAYIPGATLIPFGQLEKRMSELPKEKEIVIICRSGARSSIARDILQGGGFMKVTSVDSGMNAWQDAGYPSVSGP